MSQPTNAPFNPCSLESSEQVPAKIWELLRRNTKFRRTVEGLRRLDQAVRKAAESVRSATEKVCNAAQSDRDKAEEQLEEARRRRRLEWERSRRLVESVIRRHVFAGIALQWLVPDPLLILTRLVVDRHGKVREQICELRPDELRESQRVPWRAGRAWAGGSLEVRGPEIHWQTSNRRRFCDRAVFVQEWRRWKPGTYLFDCDAPWPETPEGFQQALEFAWRYHYDSRPVSSITRTRRDAPHPHECTFILEGGGRAWEQKMLGSLLLAGGYRLFAIPKTVLTKGAATEIGEWLASQLKAGTDVHGGLLRGGLLNEAELLGTDPEWKDWLGRRASQAAQVPKDAHFYRRCRYMDSLVSRSYPCFDLAALLAPPKHRARGKRYVPKGGQS